MYSSLDAAIANIKKFSRCKNFHYPNIPQVGDIADFKPEPKFNLTKDENYQEALAFINDNFTGKSKYYDFIHLTKLSNLSSIIKIAGVFSISHLESGDIKPNLLTNNLSKELDNRRNLGDYVHLSIISNNYMLRTFIEKHPSDDFAIILISPFVLFYHAFIMSDQNATANAAHIGRYSTIKNYLNFISLYSIQEFPSYDVAQNSLYKISQAEVMIYEKIPLKFISEIIPLVRNWKMHAIRPIFYAIDKSPFVKSVDIKFEFFSGFALSQKIKSIDSLLNSAKRELKSEKILEISKASPSPLGRALSAFNLKLRLKDEDKNFIEASVERFFQGSKFFERGGPFEEIIFSAKAHPKKYPPLKNSGNFCGFELFGERFSTEPKTYFYDFLYLSALKQNLNLADEILKYDYFSDIEFNPKKSFSAQSRAATLFVGLSRNGIFKEIFADKDTFFDFYCKNFKRESLF